MTDHGRVAEWPNASVLKTEGGVTRPGVRIPPLPIPREESPAANAATACTHRREPVGR